MRQHELNKSKMLINEQNQLAGCNKRKIDINVECDDMTYETLQNPKKTMYAEPVVNNLVTLIPSKLYANKRKTNSKLVLPGEQIEFDVAELKSRKYFVLIVSMYLLNFKTFFM